VVSAWLAVAAATVFYEYAAMHSILVLTLLSLFFQQHGQRFLFIIGTLYPTVSTTTKPIPPSPKPYVKYERICVTDFTVSIQRRNFCFGDGAVPWLQRYNYRLGKLIEY
jgi:hypothetical protein